ncbi:HDOD domain-containing protein [Pseudoduganella violaceinigra]|uniref:HDOD domain-containing protein n=1 Tax=Pseudoduganella violaceinigra TaxID=246602 RepID=UPI00040D6B78|nr:HDOD domain-containing protein [Pseudoduganella violaceinigra]
MPHPDQDIRHRLLIARLPAMPQILIKLIELLQADDAGMPELAALIAKDAGMVSKILALANSSAYPRHSRTLGLEQALVSLGTDTIKTLVIAESVFQTFSNFPHSGSTDLRAFWKGSLSTAVIARDLARALDYPHVEEAYLAGLLHNVGRLALLATAPKEYAYNFRARDDEALCAVEQRTLDITHAEAGAWLIERWQLDSFLADAVLYHHEPAPRLEAAHPLIRIVRAAHQLGCHAEAPAGAAAAAALCGLAEAQLDALLTAAARQVARAAQALGIDLAGADDRPAPAAAAPAPPPPDPVQARLSEEVRNMLLVQDMGQSLARQQGEAGLLEAMTRSARILFDLEGALILLESPAGHALQGAGTGAAQQRLAGFSVPLDKPGLLADAANGRRLAFAVRTGGIAEEQLLRMLGSEALVCLPLVAGQRCLGLIVGGLPAWQLPLLQKKERFLQAFGSQAAKALESALAERGNTGRQQAQMAEDYRAAARRVVHEVNNPLSIIKNYLSVLDAKLARREAVVAEVSILNEEVDRVGQLVAALAEPPPPDCRGAVNLARVVDEVLRLLRASAFLPASVQLVTRMQDGPQEIEGEAGPLKQILLNLVKNAIEAQPDGGRIEIANRGLVNRDRGRYVELAVSDSGPGLAPDVLANLFGPVPSSKPGPHHGLGLSIVHSLVGKLDGMISCRSSAHGTSFELLLPVRGGASQPAALPSCGARDAG